MNSNATNVLRCIYHQNTVIFIVAFGHLNIFVAIQIRSKTVLPTNDLYELCFHYTSILLELFERVQSARFFNVHKYWPKLPPPPPQIFKLKKSCFLFDIFLIFEGRSLQCNRVQLGYYSYQTNNQILSKQFKTSNHSLSIADITIVTANSYKVRKHTFF